MPVDQAKQEAHLAKLRTMTHAKSFLGREFLTWLWYHSENHAEPLTVIGPSTDKSYLVDLWIDDRVTLEAPTGKSHYHTMKGGDPSQSAEAAAALITGKVPKDLKLGMTLHEFGEYIFTLNGDDISPRTVQLPEPPEAAEDLESFSTLGFRMTALDALCDVIDGLFSLFMDDRVDQNRHQEFLNQIREWIKARPTGHDAVLH